MERNLFKPFLIIAGLMVVTIFALIYTVDVQLEFIPGVVMKLPEQAGDWSGNELRFCHNPDLCAKDYRDTSFYISELEIPDICPECGQKLFTMARAEKEALPPDTEFVKSSYTNSAGTRLMTSIVLSGTERDSIHRPQRCLKAQGNALDGEYTMTIPMEGRAPLMIRVIQASRILRTAEGDVPYSSYYAYWFVGQDHETPHHLSRMTWLAWNRVAHNKASRWAYIAVQGVRSPDNKEYEETITDYVQNAYPFLLTDSLREKLYK